MQEQVSNLKREINQSRKEKGTIERMESKGINQPNQANYAGQDILKQYIFT